MPKFRNLLRKLFGKEVPVVPLTAEVAQQIANTSMNGEKLPFEVDWKHAGFYGSHILTAALAGQYSTTLEYHISLERPNAINDLKKAGFAVNEGFVSNTYDRTWIQWYPHKN